MKRVVFSGLMLMSFFFGAGNLIYPPLAGLQAGDAFLPAISGFTITAVLIPFLTIAAVALSGDSALSISGRVGKIYGFIFTIVIIASIGPLFGIPRVANVSLNLGISPILQNYYTAGQEPPFFPGGLLYIVFFFFVAFILSLYGERLVDSIGKFLSPALVIAVAALVIVFSIKNSPSEITTIANRAQETNYGAAFLKGAVDGYGTLDAIAAVAFAGLIVNALRPSENTPPSVIMKNVIQAGVIACVLLAIIYFGLAYIGNQAQVSESARQSGAKILAYAAQQSFGEYGQLIFAIIIFLACITTAVGLLKTLSTYSRNLFGFMSEKNWLIFYVLLSALLSVRGLDSVIKTSVPMIYLTYPITICLVILTIFNHFTKERAWIYRCVAIFVTPVAFADAFKIFSANYFEKSIDLLGVLRDIIPFANSDFSWVAPLLLGVVVGSFFPKVQVNQLLLGDIDAPKRRRKQQAQEEFDDVIS